jgi:undecaprenyl-diphosphatase
MLDRLGDWLQAHDMGMLYWFGTLHQPRVNKFMVSATHLGDGGVVALVTVVACLLFAATRRWVAAVALPAAVLIAGALSDNGKEIAGRQRPDVSWRLVEKIPDSGSFPSGHATYAMALYGTLGLLAARRASGTVLRGLILVEGFGVALLVGISRCYVGVHYPLDVLGGWSAGLGCALIAAWADVRWSVRAAAVVPPRSPTPPEPPAAESHAPPAPRPPAHGIKHDV